MRRDNTQHAMTPFPLTYLFCLICLFFLSAPSLAQSLRGSSRSMDRQVRSAHQHDFTFLRTSGDVRRFVAQGYLVAVRPNRDFTLHHVSFPYSRPEVKLFVHRLATQYRGACGEKLVVTSLTRPTTRQPPNASRRSVHPTGMALDLRRPRNRKCRRWLEGVLLNLEGKGVLEATYESRPPHYHVALFPGPYARYVSRLDSTGLAPETHISYRVTRGDTLWEIARRYGTSVRSIQRSNALGSSSIYPGQVLKLPRGG